jgi:hypothetical protein
VLREQLLRTPPGGQEAAPERLHQEQAALAREREQRFGRGAIGRQRLLAQHRLAGRQGQACVLGVRAVRAGHIDDVHLGVGAQGLDVGRSGTAPVGREGLRLGRIARCDALQALPGQHRKGIGEAPRDAARRDQSPAQHGRRPQAVVRRWA